jgi:mono/diheme cytochrome c family protein
MTLWPALLAAMLAVPVVLSAAAQNAGQPAPDQADDAPSYRVVDGKVDEATLNGYRRYMASCSQCHGPDGIGSTFAPALTRSLERLDYEAFMSITANGLQVQPSRIMPAFGADANVWPHIDDIYRYLSARAEGALGRGRPQLLAEANRAAEDSESATAGAEPETQTR